MTDRKVPTDRKPRRKIPAVTHAVWAKRGFVIWNAKCRCGWGTWFLTQRGCEWATSLHLDGKS